MSVELHRERAEPVRVGRDARAARVFVRVGERNPAGDGWDVVVTYIAACAF